MAYDFEQCLIEQGKSAQTVAGYAADLKVFSQWFYQVNGEELTPDRLTPTDLKQYRAYLQNTQKAKPATINRRLAALRIYGKAAVSQQFAEYNPAAGIRGVKEQALAPKWLGKLEQAALIREVERRCQQANSLPAKFKAIRDRAIVVLLLNTGLRVAELCNLELGDIRISKRKGEIEVRNGKGEKSRHIPLNANARIALEEWFSERLSVSEIGASDTILTWLQGPETPPSTIYRPGVFLTNRGKPLSVRMVQAMISDMEQSAKLEELTPHVLRHTFAKNLVDMGVSLEKVSMLLGHRNLNTTKIYITPGLQDLERAVELLDS